MALQVNDWIWLRLSSRYGVSPAEAQVGDVFKRWLDERGGTWGYSLVDFYFGMTTLPTSYADAEYAYWSGGALKDAAFWIDAFSASQNEPWATNLGSGGFALRARYGVTNSAAIKDSSLYLPGITGNYASTPDAASLDVTGDIEVVIRVAADDWTPSAAQVLLGKRQTGQWSYQLALETTGQLSFNVTSDGSTAILNTSGTAPFVDGTTYWIKATRAATSGATVFSWAADSATEPTAWNLLATTVLGGAGNIFSGTSILEVGASRTGTTPLAGRFYRAIVRNGIGGTTVFDADFVTAPDGAVTFVESTGKTVTVNAVADSNDPVLLPHTGTNYLYLTGVNGNYASTAAASQLNVAGDLELLARVSISSVGTFNGILSNQTSAVSGGYWWYLQNPGAMTLRWSTGTAETYSSSGNSVFAAGLVAGETYWLRATLDVDNGSGGHQVQFFWASDSEQVPTVWNAMVQPAPGVGVTSIGPSVNPLSLGSFSTASSVFDGKFYRVIVRNGIGGTTVFDANFTTGITSGAQTTFTESSVNAATVTINRSLSGRKSVAVVRPVWLFGTDDFMEVAADPYGTYVRTTNNNAAVSNVITTHTTYDTGTATAGAATTLDDTAKAWTASAYLSRVVRITGGTGVGQVRVITANTATQLTVSPAWTTIPDATSTYVIESRGNVEADLQITARIAFDSWATGLNQPIVAKRLGSTNYSYYLYVTSGGVLGFTFTLDGTTQIGIGSTVLPFTNGTTYWIRFRRTASTGAWSVEYAADQASEPAVWTTLSSGTTTAGTIYQGTADIGIAGNSFLSAGGNNKFYSVTVLDGFAGNVAARWLAYGHPAGGNYVNVNRVLWTLGANASVVNPNPLNFGANDSYTIVTVQRTWATFVSSGTIASKWSGGGGYLVRNGFATPTASLISLNDNNTGQAFAGLNATSGTLIVLTWVVEPTQVTPYMDNTAFGTVARSVFEGSASETAFRLGSTAAGSSFNDYELLAAAVIPKALTAADIAKIVAAYQ